MLQIDIPGDTPLRLKHLVLDYNGTIAEDGELLKAAVPSLIKLAEVLDIHVITADTHGTVESKLSPIKCTLHIIGASNQTMQKLDYIEKLKTEQVAAIGNGKNDLLMIKNAALGIGVIQEEGGFGKTLQQADVICTNIESGLQLLLNPKRLIATLRS